MVNELGGRSNQVNKWEARRLVNKLGGRSNQLKGGQGVEARKAGQ